MLVDGMRGLGDNIYQRAFVKTLVERCAVHIVTPWPEVYEDLPVHFVYAATPLRTQAKNMARQAVWRWSIAPPTTTRIKVAYGVEDLRRGNIVEAMERCFGVPPATWDLPEFPAYPSGRPIAVVRPATERGEWFNPARNPEPEYIAQIAAELMRDYWVVSVADLQPKAEWLVGDAPPAHRQLHHGELGVRELLGLIRSAAVVVGGPGWIVPAAIAAGTPLFCILGGHGGHNAPAVITDPRMDLSHVGFAIPDRFCTCTAMRHRCDKTNTRLAEQWTAFRRQCRL